MQKTCLDFGVAKTVAKSIQYTIRECSWYTNCIAFWLKLVYWVFFHVMSIFYDLALAFYIFKRLKRFMIPWKENGIIHLKIKLQALLDLFARQSCCTFCRQSAQT